LLPQGIEDEFIGLVHGNLSLSALKRYRKIPEKQTLINLTP